MGETIIAVCHVFALVFFELAKPDHISLNTQHFSIQQKIAMLQFSRGIVPACGEPSWCGDCLVSRGYAWLCLTTLSLLRCERKDCSMFEPLLPLNFLRRAARLFPDQTAVVDGERRYTYRDLEARVHRLSNALRHLGV